MKVGDLVKMKYDSWKKSHGRRMVCTEHAGIVYGIAGKGVKVLMPDGSIKVGLINYWEVLSDY